MNFLFTKLPKSFLLTFVAPFNLERDPESYFCYREDTWLGKRKKLDFAKIDISEATNIHSSSYRETIKSWPQKATSSSEKKVT